MTRGRLVTFEGGEGSGKSTQAALLAGHLRELGLDAVLTREPGGTELAEKLRGLILEKPPASPASEFLMFAAARCEHIAELIAPALARGAWVVCDRYIDSTRVYQGVLAGIPQPLIDAVEANTVAPYFPDLTILLDLDPRIGLQRAQARGALTRYDSADLSYHAALRKGFLGIAKDEPERCVVVSAEGDEQSISSAVADLVVERFKLRKLSGGT